MRGDILLVHGTGLVSQLIQWRTRGPFDHVAIDLGDGLQLGAEPDGIRARPLSELGPERNISTISVAHYRNSAARVERGLRFIGALLDNASYSAADILDDVFPQWFPIRPLFAQLHAYDCSDLVARYLDEAGFLPLAEFGGDAKTVTPNDIARAFQARGLLKSAE